MNQLQWNLSFDCFSNGFLVTFPSRQFGQVSRLTFLRDPKKPCFVNLFIFYCPICLKLKCHTFTSLSLEELKDVIREKLTLLFDTKSRTIKSLSQQPDP